MSPSTLLDNSDILNDPDFKQTLTLKTSTGAWNPLTGEFDETPNADSTTSGSVQPASRADLEYLNEAFEGGSRLSEAMKYYTKDNLNAAELGTTTGANGDIVVFRSLEWRIFRGKQFAEHGHNKYWFIRINGQNGG